MLESFLSKVPAHWDAPYIVGKLADAGVTNHFGFAVDPVAGETSFRVLVDDADTLLSIIDNYQTSYLDVLLPRLKQRVTEKRAQMLADFTFGGSALPLTETTMTRIVGAVVLLREEPNRAEINWDAGLLEYQAIPRDNMLILGRVAGGYVQALFNHAKTLGTKLSAAATADDAEAIDIDAGWPTPESILAAIMTG